MIGPLIALLVAANDAGPSAKTAPPGAPDFGSRDIFMGRVELLFRHDDATFGPAVTFFSPGKVPEDTGLVPGFVGAPPETSVLLLFGI